MSPRNCWRGNARPKPRPRDWRGALPQVEVQVFTKRSRGEHFGFIRLKGAPGFARGFSRHKSGVQWDLPMIRWLGHSV